MSKINNEFMFYLALIISLFFVSVVLITSILLLLGVSVSVYNAVVSVIVTLLLLYNIKNINNHDKIKVALLSFLIVSVSIIFSTNVFDHTWDVYHRMAIGQMHEGWIPPHQTALLFNEMSLSTPYPVPNHLGWAESYPKATWYFAAAIYAITNSIQAGKSYTLILMFVTFCLFYDYFKIKLNSSWKGCLVGLLVALNPISVLQFRSYYLDGFAISLIMCTVLLMAAFFDNKYLRPKKMILSLILSFLLLNCNTKFSFIFYTGSVGILFFILFWLKRKDFTFIKASQLFACLVVTAMFAFCLVGFSPYITNMHRYGSPLNGVDSRFITAVQNASPLNDVTNNTETFFLSIFGKMNHGEIKTKSELLKIPFTFTKHELGYYHYVDLRYGGMGALWGGVFLLSSVIILIYLIVLIKNKTKVQFSLKALALLTALLFIEAALLPGTYQIRYAGFIHLIPIFALCLILYGRPSQNVFRNTYKLALVALMVCIMVVNILFTFPAVMDDIRQSAYTRATFQKMRLISEKTPLTIAVYYPAFVDLFYNLKDYHINYADEVVSYEEVNEQFEATYFNWIYFKK